MYIIIIDRNLKSQNFTLHNHNIEILLLFYVLWKLNLHRIRYTMHYGKFWGVTTHDRKESENNLVVKNWFFLDCICMQEILA